MDPTRLHSRMRKYGKRLVLLYAGVPGLRHHWTKRRPALLSAVVLCVLSGFGLYSRAQDRSSRGRSAAKSDHAPVSTIRTLQ